MGYGAVVTRIEAKATSAWILEHQPRVKIERKFYAERASSNPIGLTTSAGIISPDVKKPPPY